MKVSLAAGRWLALSATLLFAGIAAAQYEIPSRGCPVLIVNPPSTTSTTYNDWSFHTYTAPFAGVGGFADCSITREFHKPIKSIQVSIEGGEADDIGFVGSRIVTSTPEQCRGVGAVLGPVDVTDQVVVNGSRATLLLRAKENCCCTTGWGSMTHAPRANAKLHWIVQLETDALAKIETPGSDPLVTEGGGQLRFPLGFWFTLHYVKSGPNGEDLPVTSNYEIESMSVAAGTESRTLFPGKTIIAVDAAGPTTKKRFQTVHLGTAIVKVTPLDTKLPPVRYTISIDRPARLGSSYNEFDASIINFAHARGIPPQFLKGQVQKESDFNGMAYRYEPLSTEYLSIGPRGTNLRTQTPYSDYRLETSDGLTRGPYLTAADVAPRSKYFIVRDGQRRRILDTDRYVSALEIYRENRTAANWDAFADSDRLRRIRNNPWLIDYTAQTSLAASYGWFQVLYTTAHDTRWRGVNGRFNPAYLFDTPANIAAGGGTMRSALVLLYDRFVSANGGTGENRYTSLDAFIRPYQRMFSAYNNNSDYGPSVTDTFAPRFPPVRAHPIVQP